MSIDVTKLQKIVGYRYKKKTHLDIALTHKSYAAETGATEFNERMEFLGDSILSAVVADFLYRKHPDRDEGRLSQLKSQIVSKESLAKWAKTIGLGDFMLMSVGEEANGGRERDSLMADTLEAVIASMYLDGGFEPAQKFINKYLSKQKRIIVNDPKSKLQEVVQSKHQTLPDYRVLGESGPDHEKVFKIGVYLHKKLLGTGEGRCKKDAQQAAARKALRTLKNDK
ncbi:MAG: ribonuclease III [Endomicrobiales bacterium]